MPRRVAALIEGLPRRLATLIDHAWHARPWAPDVLFGGVLFTWGLAIMRNPQLLLKHEAWLRNAGIPAGGAAVAAAGFATIVSIVGLVHGLVGFFRIEWARKWAALAALYVFWGVARMIDTWTGYPPWGGYVMGEMLTIAGVW